jgi:hypothetical protein
VSIAGFGTNLPTKADDLDFLHLDLIHDTCESFASSIPSTLCFRRTFRYRRLVMLFLLRVTNNNKLPWWCDQRHEALLGDDKICRKPFLSGYQVTLNMCELAVSQVDGGRERRRNVKKE